MEGNGEKDGMIWRGSSSGSNWNSARRRYMCVGATVILGVSVLILNYVFLKGNRYNEGPDKDVPSFEGSLESKMLNFTYGTIHALEFGSSDEDVQVFAIHGMDHETQSAGHWDPLYGMLKSIGSFSTFDAPGYGESTVKSYFKSIPRFVGALGLYEVMKDRGIEDASSGKRVVLVARGWGAEVVMGLLREYEELRDVDFRFIFIAPTPEFKFFHHYLKEIFKSAKGLIIWAEDDPVVPMNYRKYVKKQMPQMEQVILPGISSHYPETAYPGTVSDAILKYMKEQ
ncbi:hypothetical protein NDN08_007396 [Rhodosorus marinus]|uniref:AB hydrolase-1 domain-containing protein n=1 Tax=Rhodosorus marinus TaxID=101924 RepID=A0AAV8UXF7_9RHOD|nr:hypothetical protein NDN08_007396 [Rhodosorus marinus]